MQNVKWHSAAWNFHPKAPFRITNVGAILSVLYCEESHHLYLNIYEDLVFCNPFCGKGNLKPSVIITKKVSFRKHYTAFWRDLTLCFVIVKQIP